MPLFLDVRLNEHVQTLCLQGLGQGLQASNTGCRILLAVTTAQAYATNDFAVDHDGVAAYKSSKATFKAQLNPEGFVTRQGGAIRRRGEQMGGALVACSGKRLVPGNLGAGN